MGRALPNSRWSCLRWVKSTSRYPSCRPHVDFDVEFRKDDGSLAGVVTVQPAFDADAQSHTKTYEVVIGKSATERVPGAEAVLKIEAQGAANVTGTVALPFKGQPLHSQATHLLVYPTCEWSEPFSTPPAAVALPPAGTVKAEM